MNAFNMNPSVFLEYDGDSETNDRYCITGLNKTELSLIIRSVACMCGHAIKFHNSDEKEILNALYRNITKNLGEVVKYYENKT